MRGYVVKRGKSNKNSYSIVVPTGMDPDTHKYTQSWVTFHGTKKEAESRLAEILHQMDTGSFIRPDKTTTAEYLRKWINDYGKANLQPKSFERYQGIVENHLIPAFGGIKIAQLKSEHLQKHYATLLASGLSPLTVRYDHVVIHKALQTALKWGVLARNVADGVDIPRGHPREMVVWDAQEIRVFLQAVKNTSYYALFYMALFTGMRRSELLALRWTDIDLRSGEASVQRGLQQLKDRSYVFDDLKTPKSRRSVTLSASTLEVLKAHKMETIQSRMKVESVIKETDLIFSSIDGGPLRPNTVSRAWNNLARQAGVKVIPFHAARHTHATCLIKQGVNIKVVQERLGHASIQITLDTYCHVTPGMQKSAVVEFDKMFETGI